MVAGNTLQVAYTDALDATGATNQSRTATAVATAGVTGSTTISPVVAGQAVTLTVTDADLNTNAGTAQSVNVTVTNQTTNETESVLLTETGVNTGIFSGTLATTNAAGAGTNNTGNINVVAGNTLQVAYTDALDATGATNQSRTATTVATAGDPPLALTVAISTDGNTDGHLSQSEQGSSTTDTIKVTLPVGAIAGEVISLTTNTGSPTTYTLLQTDINAGYWNTTVNAPTVGNTLSVSATLTDAIGNVSAESNIASALRDSAPPALTVAISTDGNTDGHLSQSEQGSSTTDTIKVTLPVGAIAGEVISLTTNTGSPTTYTLLQTDINAGYWNTTVNAPTVGNTLSVSATLTDAIGNVSAESNTASAVRDTADSTTTGSLVQLTNPAAPPLPPPSSNNPANSMAMSPEPDTKNQATTSSNDFSSSSQQAKSQDNVLNFELSLVGSVRNQLVTEGQNYSFQIPASIFVHSNPNEQLVFEAKTSSGKALPAWLNFDPKTLKFSGVPPKGVAPETVTVTAKDSYGKEVSATFKVGISKEDNTQTKPQLDNQQGDIPVLPNTPSPNASIQKPISNTRLVNHFEALHSKQSFTQQVHMAGKLSRLQESRALLDSLKNL